MATFDLNEYFDEEDDAINEIVEENDLQLATLNEVEVLQNNENQDLVHQIVQLLNGENNSQPPQEPAVNMEFESGEQFAALCYMYAYKTGFSLQVRSSKIQGVFKEKGVTRNGTGDKEVQFHMLERVRLICTKGRESKAYPNRELCKVRIEGNIPDGRDKFVITRCDLEHNHEVDPSNSRLMSHFRHAGEYFKKRLMLNDKAGIPISRNFNSLVMEVGGYENLPFNNRDAALVSYEDAESFAWVFEKWIECMGRQPTVLLTDQDKAMDAAIRKVFPDTKHKLCLWHILQNADKNLRSHPHFTSLDRDLRALVHESFTEQEFIDSWAEMVVKYNLQQNTWVKDSYAIRRKWVPVYWRDTFCAGMSSTQRSEQTNRFLKGFVSIETGLRQFIEQYEFALKKKVEEEKTLNFIDKERPLKWDARWLVEDVFHNVYTNRKFQEVKDEVYACIGTHIEAQPNSQGFIKSYKATSMADCPFWKKERRSFNVSIDTLTGDYKCQCKLFEFRGILCRHIINCLTVLNITSIPDKYIVERWRKDVVRGYENIRVGYYDPQDSERALIWLDVKQTTDYAGQLAMHNEVAYPLFKEKMKDVIAVLESNAGIETNDANRPGQVPLKVWGKRRVQRQEPNTRATQQQPQIGDPPNKRGPGKRRIPKQAKRRRTDSQNPTPTPTPTMPPVDDASSQMSGFSSSRLRDSQFQFMSGSQLTPSQSNSQFSRYL